MGEESACGEKVMVVLGDGRRQARALLRRSGGGVDGVSDKAISSSLGIKTKGSVQEAHKPLEKEARVSRGEQRLSCKAGLCAKMA